MEKYQFSIEGQIITNPEGWKDFQITIKREADIPGLLVTSTNKFTFKKDGYTILKARFDANYNDKVNVLIDILQPDNTYLEQYRGVVILTDVSFNLEKFTAETTIEDASFQGAIQNNKNVQAFIDSGITKNGEILTAIPTFELDYFASNGSYSPVQPRTHFRLKDALDFLVRFMTDNEVKGIQSTYLSLASNFEVSLPYIVMGEEIRTNSAPAPNVSFSQVITFLQRTHDLSFDFVTDGNGDPVMRIEEKEFFFNDDITDTIRDIPDLTVKIDAQRIASHINIGNNTAFESGNCSATTRFFSFQKEDYSLRGKGNIDKLLDLTTDFITDSNVIEDVVNNNNDAFDDEVFIVLGDSAANQVVRYQDAAFCSNNFFYNKSFLNNFIIDRQLNGVPNSVTKYLTAATTTCKIELTSGVADGTVTIVTPGIGLDATRVNFNAETFDTGNNYDTSDLNNTFYDVPFASTFSFETSLHLIYSIASIPGGGLSFMEITYTILLDRFDSSFTILKQRETVTRTFNLFGGVGTLSNFIHPISASHDAATGDRVIVTLLTQIQGTIGDTVDFIVSPDNVNTHFKCLGSTSDGGVFKDFDPNDFRSKFYTFEKNLSLTRSDNIRANTRDSLIINELSDTTLDKQVWIEQMVNNIETGETSFTMIK